MYPNAAGSISTVYPVRTPRSSRRRRRSATLGEDKPHILDNALSERRESSISAAIIIWSVLSITMVHKEFINKIGNKKGNLIFQPYFSSGFVSRKPSHFHLLQTGERKSTRLNSSN